MGDELRLTVRYTDAGDGWVTAQVAEVPGAVSQGKTREEARANVIDALAVVLTPDEELAGEPRGDDSEPSGHDAWVVGDEPVVVVDWYGASSYAKGD